MRKPYIYVLLSFFALFVTSCSKESQIEGLIATKPTVVEINVEIEKGLTKTIPVTINNTVINLLINNIYVNNGASETRQCQVSLANQAGMFAFANSPYIMKAETGAELSSSAVNYQASTGYLYNTTNPVNTSNYTYVNTNEIRYGNTYTIPVKFLFNNDSSASVYAYLQVTVAPDKLTVTKVVYNKLGTLAAGQE